MTYEELAPILEARQIELFAADDLARYRQVFMLHLKAWKINAADEPDKEMQLDGLHAEYEALP